MAYERDNTKTVAEQFATLVAQRNRAKRAYFHVFLRDAGRWHLENSYKTRGEAHHMRALVVDAGVRAMVVCSKYGDNPETILQQLNGGR
mgnify:CR=1 FL=1